MTRVARGLGIAAWSYLLLAVLFFILNDTFEFVRIGGGGWPGGLADGIVFIAMTLLPFPLLSLLGLVATGISWKYYRKATGLWLNGLPWLLMLGAWIGLSGNS